MYYVDIMYVCMYYLYLYYMYCVHDVHVWQSWYRGRQVALVYLCVLYMYTTHTPTRGMVSLYKSGDPSPVRNKLNA